MSILDIFKKKKDDDLPDLPDIPGYDAGATPAGAPPAYTPAPIPTAAPEPLAAAVPIPQETPVYPVAQAAPLMETSQLMREMELLSSKLDTIKAHVDNVNNKLDVIHRLIMGGSRYQ